MTNASVNAIAVSGSNLFAGTYAGGVFLSTDNGTSWTAINSGLTNTNVRAFAVSGLNLFAGTSGGVFLSTNNGTSWTEVNSGLTDTYVFELAVSGLNLFTGTSGGVFLSTNNGTSWTVVNSGLTNTAVLALAVSGSNLFAGTRGGGVWRRPLDEMIPVELTSFAASVQENKVVLNWATATETNNQGFEIERKLFGSNYEKIGYVTGFGTTTELKSYSFKDENITSGKYSYRLKQIDFDGTFEYSNVIEVEVDFTPKEYTLYQNYPNPFNPSTTISFSIPEGSFVTLKIYDMLGREVAILISEELSSGTYSQQWNAVGLAGGIYFYSLQAGSFVETMKLVLLK